MANFNLVVDTGNFKPYTFDDIIKPELLYDKAWDEERDRNQKLIDLYGNITLPQGSQASKDYQDITNIQQSAMEDFYNKPLRQSMPSMLRAFDLQRGKMAKLKSAADNYQKYQDKVTALGSDAIIGNPLSIDDFYLGNPTAIKSISRKDTVQGAAAFATGLMKGLQSDPEFKQVYDGLLSQGWKKSITNQDIIDAVMSTNAGNKAMQYMKKYYDSLGVNTANGWDKQSQQQVMQAVENGFISALTNDTQVVNDPSRQWQMTGLQIEGQKLDNEYNSMRNDYTRNHKAEVFGKSSGEGDSQSTTPQTDAEGRPIKGNKYEIDVNGNAYSTQPDDVVRRNQSRRNPTEQEQDEAAKNGGIAYWDTSTGTVQTRKPNGKAEENQVALRQQRMSNESKAGNANTGKKSPQENNQPKPKSNNSSTNGGDLSNKL